MSRLEKQRTVDGRLENDLSGGDWGFMRRSFLTLLSRHPNIPASYGILVTNRSRISPLNRVVVDTNSHPKCVKHPVHTATFH